MNHLPEYDHTHVDEKDLVDPLPVVEVVGLSSWGPTRKWLTLLFTNVGTLLSSWIGSGEFGATERGICAAAVLALFSTYFVANQPTPGGVPEK